MDPGTLLSIGGGLLGGLFGGGGNSGPSAMDQVYAKWNQVIDMSMNLYNNTDLGALDKGLVDQFRKRSGEEAKTLMDNYSAQLEAQGYGGSYSDTEKTRTVGRFAENAAKNTADYEANLASSRPLRQFQMLPNPGSVAGGFNMAAMTDSFRDNQKSAEFQALLQIAKGILPMFKKGGAAPTAGAAPDAFSGTNLLAQDWLRNGKGSLSLGY